MPDLALEKALSWAGQFEYYSFLNGNDYKCLREPFPRILFVGRSSALESSERSFSNLQELIDEGNDWLYGYFSYDLKNEIEDLSSKNPATIQVPHLGFYSPETIIRFEENTLTIETYGDPEEIYKVICQVAPSYSNCCTLSGAVSTSTPKWQYTDHVNKIKSAIVDGEFYEMNYCIEFFAHSTEFDPIACYRQLNSISLMPFSALMRLGNTFLISASPERFLRKEGGELISQPIKGTIRRSFDKKEDDRLRRELAESEKEQAENLMIVDLVRNDLAKSSIAGSVQVEELFGIYTFEKVHQMISTVHSKHRSDIPVTDIIKNAFPMGSMTGAPKIRVMQEIDNLENSSRGLYSGAIGFFTPQQDFDFNVVIRSIVYDKTSGKISFHVGSAITYDSDPEYEYNECLLKAETIMEVLNLVSSEVNF